MLVALLDKTEVHGENILQNYSALIRIYFLETSFDYLVAHYIRECRVLSDILLHTSLKTVTQTSGTSFVRELAEKAAHYKFRIYLHNSLFRPTVKLYNKEGKCVTNSAKHQPEEEYKFTVTRNGEYVGL